MCGGPVGVVVRVVYRTRIEVDNGTDISERKIDKISIFLVHPSLSFRSISALKNTQNSISNIITINRYVVGACRQRCSASGKGRLLQNTLNLVVLLPVFVAVTICHVFVVSTVRHYIRNLYCVWVRGGQRVMVDL